MSMLSKITDLAAQVQPYVFLIGVGGYGYEQGIPGFVLGSVLTGGVVLYNHYRMWASYSRYASGLVQESTMKMAMWTYFVEQKVKEKLNDEEFDITGWVLEWTRAVIIQKTNGDVRQGGENN